MTLAGDVMAAAAVSATTLLGTVLAVVIGRTLLAAIDAGPAPRAHALAVERVASGPVLALAVHLAISAPFTQRAPCVHNGTRERERVKNRDRRLARRVERRVSPLAGVPARSRSRVWSSCLALGSWDFFSATNVERD